MIVYYETATDADVNLNSATVTAPTKTKQLPRSTDAGATTLTATLAANASGANLCFISPAGDPGSQGGSGSRAYTAFFNVTTRNTSWGTVAVWASRVSSTGTQLATGQIGTFSVGATGIKTVGPTNLDLGTFGPTDRFVLKLVCSNTNTMSAQSAVFQVNSPAGDSELDAPWSAAPPDTTPPVANVTAQTATKVSRVTGKDSFTITMQGDEAWQQYQVRLVATANDSVTQGTLIVQGPNDQSFETAGTPGGSGWTTTAGASQPLPALSFVTPTGATSGTRAFQIASNGNVNNVSGNFQSAVSQKIPIVAGNTVTVVADLNISIANGPELQMMIQFFNAAGAFLSQSVINVGNTVGSRADQTIANAVAPANAASFSYGLTINGAPGSGATATGSMTAQMDNVRVQWPPNQDHTHTFTEAQLEAVGGTEGTNMLKVFLQDLAGNWST